MNQQSSSSPLVSCRGLHRSYGTDSALVEALIDANLDIHSGQLVAIMGPSGSGKSTLLTIMGGLERPSAGTVVLDGTDLWELSPTELAIVRRRQIGYVFQEFNLLTGLTAAENVAAPLELDGESAKAARARPIECLGSVGLADRADAFPDDLSGGERQRVAIARSLVGDRRLILADEPTGALDSATGDEVLTILRGLCQPDTAVVLVTHDPRIAAYADRTISLSDGRIVSDTHGAPTSEEAQTASSDS